MKDAMDIARQRRQQHVDEIARLNAEIEELQDRIGELDTFLDFGETLIGNAPTPISARVTSAPASLRTPELREIDESDDWDDDADEDRAQQSIANVVSARNG